MKRREFLKAIPVTVGISGCVSEPDTVTPTFIQQKSNEYIYPLLYNVSLNNIFSEEKPPELFITLSNVGEKPVSIGDKRNIFTFKSKRSVFITKSTDKISRSDLEYTDLGWIDTSEPKARTTEWQTLKVDPGQKLSSKQYILRNSEVGPMTDSVKFYSMIMTETELRDVDKNEKLNWSFQIDLDHLLKMRPYDVQQR